MSKPKVFVLNDDAVQNSYGFFILSSGGKLDRFKSNPVMLADHENKNEKVIGNWQNLKVEGGVIKATPNFDVDRPIGLEISGQVERDFIKGASMGILPNWDSMERIGEKLILKEWELVEASIVPVPSNRNSIAIYSVDGKLLEESEVKTLCLSVTQSIENPELNLNIENMKRIILSMPVLLALGFKDQPAEGVEVAAVESKITELSATIVSLTKEKEALELAAKTVKEAQEAARKESITKKVELGITEGKFAATKKDEMINLGLSSESALDTVLASIPAKQNFAAGVNPQGGTGTGEVKTMEDFQKLSLELQLAFKNDNPVEYQNIVKSIK